MKRMLRAAAWIILIALTALAPFLAASMQAGRENYVKKHYDSWTGVLRLWKCEGWQSGNGSLTSWLNTCIEKFEKKHPGVYVQLTDVSEEIMKDFMNGSVNPPDMLLYSPGMLDAPYSLMEMEEEAPVRQAIKSLGLWQGTRYALPVALGGYAMAINSQLIAETPGDWSSLEMIEKKSAKTKKDIQLLNAPCDGEYRSWSAALISMFAGSFWSAENRFSAPIGEGIDLGLEAGEPEATETPDVSGEEQLPNALPKALPEDFRETEGVYSAFANGEIAAMPVTQREIRRLQQLSESGSAPDWRAEAMGLPFTDQAALISVVACEREDIEERQALCMELIELMLTAEMQTKLTVSRAFPVIELPALYQNQAGMREIEQALNAGNLLTPPAFGSEWREYAARLMDGIAAGEGTQEAYEKIREMMGG